MKKFRELIPDYIKTDKNYITQAITTEVLTIGSAI